MPVRKASAEWKGDLKGGKGSISAESGSLQGSYNFGSRFESGQGTNPEELMGAAHAGCFSMALAHGLSEAGHRPDSIETKASVAIEPVQGGFAITRITLETVGRVPGIDEKTFREQAETAKANCPVSKALAGTEIELKSAKLA